MTPTTPNIPVIAWAPDADPTVPGVMPEISNLLPTIRGYAPDASPVVDGTFTATMPARPLNGAAVQFSDGRVEMLAATSNRVYRISTGGLVDLTQSAGAYTATTDVDAWAFAIFRDRLLAGNRNVPLQGSASSALPANTLSAIAGAPSPGTFCVQRNFVVCANFAGGSWPYADGWWCSGQENETQWTPDIATQCAQGRLTATPGAIKKLVPYQDTIIGFKGLSMYRGTYTGPTGNTWSWPVLSTSVGLVHPDACVEVFGALYWLAFDGFYRYAGGGPEPIASAPWNWLVDALGGASNLGQAKAQWDPARRVIRWYLYTNISIGAGIGVAYHIDSDRWGSFTVAGGAPISLTYGSVPSVTASQLLTTSFIPAFFEASTHILKQYGGTPGASTFSTGDIGDDDQVAAMLRARVRYLRAPAASTMTHLYRMNLSDTVTTGQSATRDDGKFDVSHSSRWHRMRFQQSGMYEVIGFSVAQNRAGIR